MRAPRLRLASRTLSDALAFVADAGDPERVTGAVALCEDAAAHRGV